MTKSDSVISTPPTNTSATNPLGLARQQREREKALKRVAKLRRRASDEIERLLAFLDASDPYATSELEDSIDDGPIDDSELDGPENHEDEESDPAEPSLGSGAVGEWSTQAEWAVRGIGCVDAEDEHDGAEPENESGCGAKEDDEPSLGWTIDGVAGSQTGDDRELQDHASVRPQRRTRLGKGVHAAPNYCPGSRVLGLTTDQQARFNEERRGGKPGMVS